MCIRDRIKAGLPRGPDGSLRGRSLNAVKTEVIDNNSKVMEGVPVAISSSDEGVVKLGEGGRVELHLSLIHISEPTRPD